MEDDEAALRAKKDAVLRLPARLQDAVEAAAGRDEAREAADTEGNGTEWGGGHFAVCFRGGRLDPRSFRNVAKSGRRNRSPGQRSNKGGRQGSWLRLESATEEVPVPEPP